MKHCFPRKRRGPECDFKAIELIVEDSAPIHGPYVVGVSIFSTPKSVISASPSPPTCLWFAPLRPPRFSSVLLWAFGFRTREHVGRLSSLKTPGLSHAYRRHWSQSCAIRSSTKVGGGPSSDGCWPIGAAVQNAGAGNVGQKKKGGEHVNARQRTIVSAGCSTEVRHRAVCFFSVDLGQASFTPTFV